MGSRIWDLMVMVMVVMMVLVFSFPFYFYKLPINRPCGPYVNIATAGVVDREFV